MFLHAVLPGLLSRYKYNRHKAAKFSSINVDGPNIKIQNGNNAVFPPFNIAEGFPLQEPNEDKELRPVFLKTECRPLLGTLRFEKFSSWDRLVECVALLQRLIIYRKGDGSKILPESLDSFQSAENFIIKTVQQEVDGGEIVCLRSEEPLPRNSSILALNPYLDDKGIIRICGRLKRFNDDSF